MLEAKGYNGTIRFDGENVTIVRKGLLAKTNGFGDITFPLASVEQIELKPANLAKNGSVRFVVAGVDAPAQVVATDGYAVIFTFQQRKRFDELKSTLDALLPGTATSAEGLPTQGAWQRGEQRLAEVQQRLEDHASFPGWSINNGIIRCGLKSGPVAGAHAEAELASNSHKVSFGRVVTGGLMLGPVGAVLGGMAKKDKSTAFLIVALADGTVLNSEFPANQLPAAKMFAVKINHAAQGANQ